MSSNTPPKHKTPNYRLVRHERALASQFRYWPERVEVWWTWEPVPLRHDRKDL